MSDGLAATAFDVDFVPLARERLIFRLQVFWKRILASDDAKEGRLCILQTKLHDVE